jgi:hypothetical protein
MVMAEQPPNLEDSERALGTLKESLTMSLRGVRGVIFADGAAICVSRFGHPDLPTPWR